MVDDDDDSLAELMALDRLSAGHGAQERRANPAPRVNPLDKPKEIARKWKAAQLQKQVSPRLHGARQYFFSLVLSTWGLCVSANSKQHGQIP